MPIHIYSLQLIRIIDNSGNTPFWVAATERNIPMLNKFLEIGVDPYPDYVRTGMGLLIYIYKCSSQHVFE